MTHVRTVWLRSLFVLLLLSASTVEIAAQAPSGTVAGVVKDPAGSAVAGAGVVITNLSNGLTRTVNTSDEGSFSAAVLLPGTYHLTVEALGFNRLALTVIVETGATTTVNLSLQIGGCKRNAHCA